MVFILRLQTPPWQRAAASGSRANANETHRFSRREQRNRGAGGGRLPCRVPRVRHPVEQASWLAFGPASGPVPPMAGRRSFVFDPAGRRECLPHARHPVFQKPLLTYAAEGLSPRPRHQLAGGGGAGEAARSNKEGSCLSRCAPSSLTRISVALRGEDRTSPPQSSSRGVHALCRQKSACHPRSSGPRTAA